MGNVTILKKRQYYTIVSRRGFDDVLMTRDASVFFS